MLLRLPEPYDFALSTERFRAFGPDRANLWHEGGLHRVLDGRELRLEAAPGGVRITVPKGQSDNLSLSPFQLGSLRHLVGAPFDLDAFAAFAAGEPVLGPVVARLRGFRPPLVPDPFEALVTSITAQQVSLFSAFAVRNRFVAAFGEPGEHAHAFPAAERVARASEDELVALGFSRRKAEYVLGVARAEVDWDGLALLPDEEVKARIVAVRGLGEWTADWYLARHLGRPTAWPAGDLGLRKAVAAFYGGGDDVRALGERFHPFQNLAAHYLLLALRVP